MKRAVKNKEEVKPKIPTAPVQEIPAPPVQTGPVKIRWQNKGGTLRLGRNRIIKPNEKFSAYPDEIPNAFRDVIIALEPIPEDGLGKPIPVNIKSAVYSLKQKEDAPGFFDIVNSIGKKINEKPLDEKTAKQLLIDLQR